MGPNATQTVRSGASEGTTATTQTVESADPNPTAQRAVEDGYDIPVRGGSIPADHERTFARTESLLGVNASPPDVLLVRSPEAMSSPSGPNGDSGGGRSSSVRSFLEVMGFGQDSARARRAGRGGGGSSGGDERDGTEGDDADESPITVAAYAPSAHSVVVNERLTAPRYEAMLERTLAHEYTHTVQFQREAFRRLQRALTLRESYSRDEYLVYLAVVEGAGVYTEAAYERRYLGGRGSPSISATQYRNASSAVQFSLSRYHFGYRYLDARLDSPAGLAAVYDDPPRTTEQLLHGPSSGSEPPKRLAVATALGDERAVGRANTNGELMTRILLATELNASRAASGADGWGNDEVVPVAGRNRSFVWATRWDSPVEADEFDAALTAYLSARADRSGGVWRDGPLAFRVVRVGEESVALLAGSESFVTEASVSGSNSSVEVSAA